MALVVVEASVDSASIDTKVANSKTTMTHNWFMTVAPRPVKIPHGKRLKLNETHSKFGLVNI